MTTIITALILFGVIIMAHELGHFLTARLVGIYAEEFSIGMGPKIIQYKGKETVYSLRALPIGGYVKFIGEDEKSDDPRAFGNAKVWKRLAVLVAGAGMNFILAILLLAAFFMFFGVYETSLDVLEIEEGLPAQAAGLKVGDRIIEIDDVPLDGEGDNKGIERFKEVINEKGSQPIKIVIQRNDQTKTFLLQPKYSEEHNTYQIGIAFGRYKRYGLFSALWIAFVQTGRLIVLMLQLLGSLIFQGQGLNEVMGPVGMVGEIGRAVKAGFAQVINLAIIITLNLGIINLIPFPALDGGRLALLLVEGVRGRPLDPEKEGYIHFIGFVVLILLMIVVTFKDVAGQWF